MYNYFAFCYDDLTENVEYEVRSDYISDFFNEFGVGKNASVLDLACGTGTMSLLMKNKGYTVTGIDSSTEMLSFADSKANGTITFLKAEMQNFRLSAPADACMCNLDSINHLQSIRDVENTFKCVFESLSENGIFVFDVNTVYKHNNILADNTFVFDRENYFLSWDNELMDNNRIKIMLDIFMFNGTNYDRYSETFIETAYSIRELSSALSPYFDILGIYDDVSLNEPADTSERLYFVCKRK